MAVWRCHSCKPPCLVSRRPVTWAATHNYYLSLPNRVGVFPHYGQLESTTQMGFPSRSSNPPNQKLPLSSKVGPKVTVLPES